MRSFTLIGLVCTLLVLATVSAAWPWPAVDGAKAHGMIVGKRAAKSTSATETGDSTKTAEATGQKTETAKETASTTGTGTAESTATGTNTAKETGKKKGKTTGKAKSTGTDSSATSTSIDPRLPPGGIKMITPSANAVNNYYKVGEYVTFKWNYTSLVATPSAVDVVASCSLNSQIYTISSNMSVHQTGAVTWDTGKYQASATVPLLTATYTLIVYDVDSAITAVAGAGHLSSQNQFSFGMYLPQPYTPLNAFECATCGGAMSDMERQALGFMFGMVTITILSFTWFAGGVGVFAT